MIAQPERDARRAWAHEVMAILDAMPTRQAHALRLLYFEQLPERDVAVRLGVALAQARLAAAEGLRHLGQALCAGPVPDGVVA